ncbi:MAG: glycosyltransferase family 2 protein [Sedimentisphaerales bacterium]|nr:glycosyltransferase family 2 protein [Sedimentisphaerales bacterium]
MRADEDRTSVQNGHDAKAGNTYVLITPAYNEAALIAQTIESVLAQTVLPLRWVIVDDGSTDETAAIINQYTARFPWMECGHRVRRPDETYYGSNVYAILQGYERLKGLSFDYLAILDADIVLCPDYYERIIRQFDANRELGIATGTYLEEIGGRMVEAAIDRWSTPKALQVFRRACYEKIGGYIPCRNGGEDTCTEIMARMNGWQTWSFPQIRVVHRRPIGKGDGGKVLRARFRQGLSDYCLASHPLFMLAKSLRRCVKEKPYVLAGLARLFGFTYGYVAREPRQIPHDAGRYVRKEQMKRLLASVGIGPPLWQPAQPDAWK